MEGQSSVNIFTLNNKRKDDPTQTGGSSIPMVGNGGYTREMEKLDKELEAEGLKIERLSDQQKLNYVNSLTDSEYERLLQYRDAGYSFGSAKALVDLEKQRNNSSVTRGYRAEGFQLGEPLGGAESLRNRANFIGRVTELLDDRVQNTLVPAMTVDQKEKRTQKLMDKYNNMTEAEWDKIYQQYMSDVKSGKAKYFTDDTLQENLDYYWKNQNKSFWDDFWGADIKTKEDIEGNRTAEADNYPSLTQMIANAPGSALSNASAVTRGVTNPADTLAMLFRLIGTKEGRDILAYRYLDEEGRNESIEKDPVGWILDLFDFGALGLNLSSKATRGVSTAQRLVGASKGAEKTSKFADNLAKASRSLENVADMGISEAYSKLLDKQLGKLSAGGKTKNLIGDYISMTQRPLQTIWNGANPKDEKGNQPYQNGSWTYEGISKGANKVREGIKDKIQTSATGLTPEVRERIRQNPFIREYWERIEAMINDEGAPMDNQKIMEGPIEEVGNELLRRLEEYESKLQEDGAEYQVLDKVTRPFNISGFMSKVYDVFNKNGISLTPDGELYFRTTANPADMNPVNVAWNLIKAMEPNFQNMTIKQIREFRQQLRSLIKYHSDAPSTKYSKKVLRELIDGAFNSVVHKEIPSLAKVDEIYTKRLNELKEFKDGLIYQQGEKRGQIKDNFYSIISTLNTQNRQKMKARVEKLFPELGARVEAIRMLPILAKAYQNSPQMMKALFQKAGFLGGLTQSGGVKQAVMGWLIGIVADELFAKPMGEKWRKQAIDELIKEVSPEALQKLAEIKSKIDAGVELTEQEKLDLQTAMQEIAIKEYEYLDEKHKKAIDEMLAREKANQPKLPGTMDTIGPDGTIKLSAGKQVNNPEDYKPTPRNRKERVQQMQEEYAVDTNTAEEMTNTVEDFLDEIGANIEGKINTREVNYERFSEKTLTQLMEDPDIPQSEKVKIQEVLETKPGKEQAKSEGALDQEFAYRIQKLQEEEQRVGKVGKNKVDRSVAKKQQADLEAKRDALKVEMRERYGGTKNHDQERAEDKYLELAGKGIDYINNYKKSKGFREEQAEKKVLEQLKEQWKKEPKFVRNMDDNTAEKRKEFLDNAKPENGYKLETTDYNDRYVNEQTGDKGAIKFNKDGSIEVVTTDLEGFMQSGIMKALPDDAIIKVSGEDGRATAGELKDYEYQTVGRANPNEKTISAEEGLNLKSFKGDRTIGELADDYGLKKQIVEKIFTAEGEEALGRAKGDLIELVKEIKEGTAPHEVFHPIFNMVNSKRRQEIIDLVKKHKGMSEADAKEWLADSFSEYFRTGKFDTKPIPEGFVNKVKRFFNKVREFINGTWRSKKKIQKLFDDIMENKIERQKLEGGEYEYQLGTDEIYEKAEKVLERKLDRLLTNKSYSFVALKDAMAHTYNPDFDTWLNKINTYLEENRNASIRSMLNRRELVDAYNIMQEYASDGVMKFYETAEKINNEEATIVDGDRKVVGNDRMNETYELLKEMKKRPLKIPENLKYEPQTYELRQALYDIETPLNELVEYYDPDPLEWRNGLLESKIILVREVPKYEELVKIQNLLDKFIESGWKRIEGTFNDKMINKLVEKRINNNSRLGSTFDERAIKEIGEDIESTVQNRTADFVKRRHKENGRGANMPDEAVGDFAYALGYTYDPNVDVWKTNMEKELKKMFPKYDPEDPLIWEHQYQTLKSRINQLGKYDNIDYQMLREDDYSGTFMQGVADKKAQQVADKSEKATQDLVAVSGFSIDNFEKQIKGLEGKSPMPSIGITDPNVPHENRGELTLVFGKDTVDPKANPENVIYGSDAYTPMFPSTKTTGGLDLDDMHRIANQIMDKYLGSDVGVRELIVEWIKDLKDLDITDNEAWEGEYIRFQARFEQQVNSILEDRMDEGVTPIELEDKEIHEIWEEIITPILQNQPKTVIRAENYNDNLGATLTESLNEIEGLFPDMDVIDNMSRSNRRDLTSEVRPIWNRLLLDAKNKKRSKDTINNKIRELVDETIGLYENYISLDLMEKDGIDHTDFDAQDDRWDKGGGGKKMSPIMREVEEHMDSVVSNIEELVQYYINSVGDREYTAENALEAMKLQRPTNRGTRPGSYRDMIGAEGTKIDNLEDVRKKNFGKMLHDEYLGNIEYLENRYDQIVSIIGDEYMGYPDDGLFHHGDHDEEVREMIKDAYDPDIEKFKDNLPDISKEDGTVEKLKLPDDILQRIIDVVEQGKKVPVRFSESKPQRVVDLYEEVKYVLVPDKDVDRVNKMVEGTPLEGKVEGYKADDVSAPRSRKIKELQKKYGNIFFSFGGAVMPIAMLLMMAQGGDDEGEGQQA